MVYNSHLNLIFDKIRALYIALDCHTGNVKRAPVFYQKLGFRMFLLYRTAFESRLYFRQIRGFKFMIKAILNNKPAFWK